jgi:ribonucleoside-diphosphate reductase alpha chain
MFMIMDIFTKYSLEEIDKVNSLSIMIVTFFHLCWTRQVVDKYLVQDRSNGGVYETPQFMYMMIALTIFQSIQKKQNVLCQEVL